MTVVNVLVVDDELAMHGMLAEAFASERFIRLFHVTTPEAASEIIRSVSLSLAVIDFFLVRGNVPGTTGEIVIRELLDLRPTCPLVMMTQDPGAATVQTYHMLDPARPAVKGVISKASKPIAEVIRDLVAELVPRQVEVKNAAVVRNQINAKLSRWRRSMKDQRRRGRQHGDRTSLDVELTRDEVTKLVSKILIGDDKTVPGDDDVVSIELQEQGGGKSSSAVFKGVPVTGGQHRGILCIFKFGPKREMEEEYRNYGKFVRYYRSTYRRVEALGFAAGDTIAAICYSFAGRSPDGADVKALQDFLEAEDPAAILPLQAQLDPSRKEWYRQVAPLNESLIGFFQKHFHVEAEAILRDLTNLVTRDKEGLQGLMRGYLTAGDRPEFVFTHEGAEHRIRLPHPRDLVRIHELVARPRSCIIHGDLNGGNILIAGPTREGDSSATAEDPSKPAEETRTITIDYRHTRRGPIFIDFAALETSVRLTESGLSKIPVGEDLKKLAALEQLERETWEQAWALPTPPSLDVYEKNSGLYWARISSSLIALARGNFERSGEPNGREVSRDEYAATCIMYCLRLLQIRELGSPYTVQSQVRLLAWMSALLRAIRP